MDASALKNAFIKTYRIVITCAVLLAKHMYPCILERRLFGVVRRFAPVGEVAGLGGPAGLCVIALLGDP